MGVAKCVRRKWLRYLFVRDSEAGLVLAIVYGERSSGVEMW